MPDVLPLASLSRGSGAGRSSWSPPRGNKGTGPLHGAKERTEPGSTVLLFPHRNIETIDDEPVRAYEAYILEKLMPPKL